MKNSNNNGVSIVAAIAIMMIMAILGLVMVSLLGTASRGVVDYQRAAQAFGLAQAGLNWYMMQLAGTADWSAATDQTGISLGQGTFDVALTNKAQPQPDSNSATRMDITVTGKVSGNDGVNIQRTMSERAWKLPSASKFALFWGRDVANLSFTNVAVNGDFWSIGTTSIPSSSSVTNGSAYRPTTENISGAGTYTEADAGAFPYFSNFSGSTATNSTPPFTAAYYNNLIAGYDTLESACTTTTDDNRSSSFVLSGTICCRDFNTNGAMTISGSGIIIANRDIRLHDQAGDSGTLTIFPSAGGTIVFIGGQNININSGAADTAVTMNPGVRLYSKSDSVSTGMVDIINSTTDINGALILADRRITVNDGALIRNSTLFVNDPHNSGSPATNNNLTVTTAAGLGTTVGTIAEPCSLISVGRGTPTLAIVGRASVAGLVYQKDANNLGRTNISGGSSANRVNITGTVIANMFSGNNISNANITYDPAALPEPPPEGFDGFIAKKPGSWSGN